MEHISLSRLCSLCQLCVLCLTLPKYTSKILIGCHYNYITGFLYLYHKRVKRISTGKFKSKETLLNLVYLKVYEYVYVR